MWWFLLAFVLLVAVLILLRLDAAKRRGSTPRNPAPGVDDGGRGSRANLDDDEVDPSVRGLDPGAGQSEQSEGEPAGGDNEDAGPDPAIAEAGGALAGMAASAAGAGLVSASGSDQSATSEHGAGIDADSDADAGTNTNTNAGADAGTDAGTDANTGAGNGAEAGVPQPAPFQRGTAAEREGLQGDTDEPQATGASDLAVDANDTVVGATVPPDPTIDVTESADVADNAGPAEGFGGAADHQIVADEGVIDGSGVLPTESAAGAGVAGGAAGATAAPKLSDRLRKFLHGRRPNRPQAVESEATERADPLADSLVVRWLEERDFAPTPTPAPDFRHGDFAGGLPALGTVSHGVFRGRRALMGVTGGRGVLALQRDTASDVVLDLSRPDVDAEPGFHDAGDVAALEARASDYGRLELIDRDRLADAVRGLPSDVRRVWAESEWLAATVDSAENPTTWDDTVVALYEAADVLAPLSPVGGRARPLPADIDPGAPGAAAGPDADPSGGIPEPAERHAPQAGGAVASAGASDSAGQGWEAEAEVEPVAADPARRAGHLRLVPDRSGHVRPLTEEPVVADQGVTTDGVDVDAPAAGGTGAGQDTGEDTELGQDAEATQDAELGVEPDPAEVDPFAEIMEPSEPVPSRGDVAADYLESRPPLSRPTRGAGHAYPEDASVPPLAAGVNTGAGGIKPIGSEDNEDEIRSEVERFDAARIDGGSDLDSDGPGRHTSGRHEGEVPAWLQSELATAPEGGRRRRRAEPDADGDSDADGTETLDAEGAKRLDADGTERPGAEPDVEQTMRMQLPPDIRD